MKILVNVLLVCCSASLFALTNEEVSIKSYNSTGNYVSALAQLEMSLRDNNGNVNKRDLSMKKMEGEKGDKTLLEFNSPMDVKGTVLLTHENLDSDDDQWLYMPSIKKTKRIISKNKSGSFMGSEFSYEDLSSQHYKRFDYTGNAENVILGSAKLIKSVRVPNDQNSGYSKEVIWVEPKNFLIQKIDYYDKSNNLLKTATMSEYQKISGIWRVSKVIMKNIQTKKETTLQWNSEKIKAGLVSKDFARSLFP